jgi:Carboxypeptidase regulatory-like domain/TonB dependent receptor
MVLALAGMRRTELRKTFGLMAVMLLLSLRGFGQATTAELSGTVQDASGAVVPDAQVTANNIATNIAHSTVSEKSGHYVLGQLPPGDYTLTVEAKGFSKLVQTGLNLQVNQQAQLDLTLKVGAQSETVEVVSQAPLLESESSSVGTVVGEQMVNQLPLNGRNFTQLATLSPGVTGVGQSATGTIESGTRPDNRRPASEIFSNGNREGDNNFLIDGVDDNERLTLSIVVRPPVASVREFKIQTNLYSADIGRNSGAVIDVITKSGTNKLHGSVFEYIRNSAVDARSYFNKVGSPFPSFRLNQFGFSVGGPVVLPKVYNGKNRTFFFADYEGFRNTTQSFVLGNVPTIKERAGDFSETATIYDPLTTRANPAVPGGFIRDPFLNNFIPLGRRDPISVKMINAYPLPTSSGRFNNYSSNLIQSNNANSVDARIDEQITSKDIIFGRYSYQSTTNIAPSTYPVTTIPGISTPVHLSDEASFAGTSATPTQQVALGYTRVFTPTIVNDLRFGFSRYRLDYVPVDFATNGGLGNQLGVPNSNVTPREQNLPIFSPSTYLGVGQTRSLPLYRRENTFQVFDNLVWTRGSHTLKFGVDFRRRQLTIYQTNMGNGRFNFSPALTDSRNPAGSGGDSAASMLLGYPTSIGHDYTFPFPGIRLNEYGLYAADDWRMTRKLTVNYGLRWDYFSPPSEELNRWANFNPTTGTMDVAGRNGVSMTAGVLPFRKDWGPRVGFAYQALPNTVVRGGFGLFYNASGSEALNMRLARNIPFGLTSSVSPGDITPGTTVSQGFPALPTVNFALADNPTGSQSSISPAFRPSYAEQFNLGVEQEIAPLNMVLKLSGVGNLGRRIYNTYNINQAIPGPTALNTRRPLFAINPNISDVNHAASNGIGDYYALQFVADKRVSHGLSAQLGYAWGHSIDDTPLEFSGGAAGPTPQDPRFLRAERSNSIFDQRQRLTLTYLWVLPFGKGQRFMDRGGPANFLLGGWQTNGLLFTQSGLYFSPVLGTSTTNTGTSSRPNISGTVTYPRTLTNWFSASAYSTPVQYTYGNAGRNSLIGPGRTNFDMSVFKSFPVHEQTFFQFRFEAFNVFNHPQFGYPNATVGTAQVGSITSVVGNPRNLQASLQFQF